MKRIKEIILENAAFYDSPMNEIKLKIFAEVLETINIELVEKAFTHFRNKPGQKFLPMPADIISFCNSKGDPDSDAKETISKVVRAVSKHGYIDPIGARIFMGELGWRIVERIGGWQYLCENLGVNIDVTTFTAQGRDLARATLIRIENGFEEPNEVFKQLVNQKKEIEE